MTPEERETLSNLAHECEDEVERARHTQRLAHEAYCARVLAAPGEVLAPVFFAQASVIANHTSSEGDASREDDEAFLHLCLDAGRLLALNTIGPVE